MAAADQRPHVLEFYGGYPVYSESGVDLTLLRQNLRRPLEERWERNGHALVFGLTLQRSGKGPHGSDGSVARSPVMTDAVALVRLLLAHQVQFVVVGGQALRAQGSATITEDIDICYQRTPANLAALVAALASIHPYLRGAPPGLPFRFNVPTLAAGMNFSLTTDHGDINLLGEVSGIGAYDQVVARSEERTLLDQTIRILSLDGLIVAKRAAGRTKDRLHLLELEELKKLRQGPGA